MSRLLALSVLLAAAGPAPAGYIPVDFSAHHNLRIQNLQGSASLFPSGNVTLGGVPYHIPAAGRNAWSAASAPGPNPRVIDVGVGVYGVDSVHMLLNTLWGETAPGTRGRVEFYGSGGATFTWFLDGNDDVRDYLLNTFTNDINNTTTTNVFTAGAGVQNRVRLDVLTLDLPPAFLTQTLDRIRLVDNGANLGEGPNPQRLLVSGITVRTVPEPGTVALVAVVAGVAVVTAVGRRRAAAHLAACLIGLVLLTGTAPAQTTDEAAKLRREVELLRRENELLTRENGLLKKEVEQLKAGGTKKVEDGLPLGSEWKGILYFTGGKTRVQEEATLKVTAREGKAFTAEFWVKNHTDGKLRGLEIKGSVDGGGITCKGSKVLDGATWAVGILDVTWTGQLKDRNKRVVLDRKNKDGSSHRAELTVNE